jgi:hypothetical protein
MAEVIAPAHSKAQARRLRSTLTKKKLYQHSREKMADTQKVDRLIDTVNNLVIMLQGCTIHCPYPTFDAGGDSDCWDPFYGLSGNSSCDPHRAETIGYCHDSYSSPGSPEGNHFSSVTRSHLRTVSVPSDDSEMPSDDSETESSLPDWVALPVCMEDDVCTVPCCKCHKPLQACACQWEVAEGATVFLSGLQRAPELNGEIARVGQWIPDDGRWSVQLQSGDNKKVKPENLRGNPRDMAAELNAVMEKSLEKFDGLLEKLAADAVAAKADLDTVREQRRLLDDVPNCPSQIVSSATSLMSQVQSRADGIQSQIGAVKEERDATLANGKLFVVHIVSKFMKHGEG